MWVRAMPELEAKKAVAERKLVGAELVEEPVKKAAGGEFASVVMTQGWGPERDWLGSCHPLG